jgi:hypothetical protein
VDPEGILKAGVRPSDLHDFIQSFGPLRLPFSVASVFLHNSTLPFQPELPLRILTRPTFPIASFLRLLLNRASRLFTARCLPSSSLVALLLPAWVNGRSHLLLNPCPRNLQCLGNEGVTSRVKPA